MSKQLKRPTYSPVVHERAIRMVGEHARDYPSQWAATVSIAAKIGCSAQTLHNWVSQAERDAGNARRSDHRRAPAHQGLGA